MTIALWIVQGLLAVAFLGAGAMKLTKSRRELIDSGMEYAEDFSDAQIKTIGALEVLGAVGVVVPRALDILPMLSGLAAAGLLLTMAGAALTHIRRGEYSMITANVILGALAAFAAIELLL